jgi:hypothetical protein
MLEIPAERDLNSPGFTCSISAAMSALRHADYYMRNPWVPTDDEQRTETRHANNLASYLGA